MKIHFRRFWCLLLTLVCLLLTVLIGTFENSCCSLTETQKICEIFLRSIWFNVNNFPKIDSIVNIKTYSKIENCCVIQNILDHQHFSNLLKFQLNILWRAMSHTIYIQTKFYSEPFMSGASPLEVGVGGAALAFSVSLFCRHSKLFFFIFNYLSLKITISKIITILRDLIYIA